MGGPDWETLQLWRWDPPFASTQAGGPTMVSNLYAPGTQLNGGDIINTVSPTLFGFHGIDHT